MQNTADKKAKNSKHIDKLLQKRIGSIELRANDLS